MQDEPATTPDNAPNTPKESWRTPILIIAVMVIAFALVVGFRKDIRARWWGYQLANSTKADERVHYLQLLATLDSNSLPVARDLIHHVDVGNRSFGVALLSTIEHPDADALLEEACSDADEAIRHSAVLGLAMRKSAETVARLGRVIDQSDTESGMFVVSQLEGFNLPEAIAELGRVAKSHPKVGVRAQAIASLGQIGGDKVVGPLIDCLRDDDVFEGATFLQSQAHAALASVAPQFATSNGMEINPNPDDTNGMRAVRILLDITGESFGYLEAGQSERMPAIKRWRDWLAARLDH